MQLGTMTWSPTQSPDDDGLEPIRESSLPAAPFRAPQRTLTGMPPPTPPSRRVVSESPSVVVAPESQVPSAPSHPLAAPLLIEPTVILHGRKVDRLRAEVQLQRRAYQREHGRRLLLWGGAGAGAVALGALAASLIFQSEAPPSSVGTSSLTISSGIPAPKYAQPHSQAGDAVGRLGADGRSPAALSAHVDGADVRDATENANDTTTAPTAPTAQPQARAASARSPLLESGLEPGASEVAPVSPLADSGLGRSEKIPKRGERVGASSEVPEAEPEPVTLEQLLAE